MSSPRQDDSVAEAAPGSEDAAPRTGEPPPVDPLTGHPAVDRVLHDLEGLEQRPVAEHAAAYQQAHERLTRELDTAESRMAGTDGAES